jgi:hypothetical protein
MCTWVSSSRQAFCACAGSRACGARAWRACPPATFRACVCITAGPSTKLFACSHHPKEEPSHAFSIFKLPSCVFITAGPSTKLFTCSGIGLFYADSGFFDGNILFFFTHTFLSDRLVVSHVLPYPPPPPHVNSFVLGPTVIGSNKRTRFRGLTTTFSDICGASFGFGSGFGIGSLDSLSHSSSHALPFFSPPSFHTLAFSPAFTSVWWSA